LHASGEYDLVIVDTPPSRNALAILDAPSRMAEFFGSRLLRWLTAPYRSRLFTFASKPFYQVADRILGSRFLQDVADFFVLFQKMEAGFVKRANEVEALLVDPRTAFVVVSTLEAAPAHEARFLAESLHERKMIVGAMVANRVLPSRLASTAAIEAANDLAERTGRDGDGMIAAAVAAATGNEHDTVDRVLHQMATRFDDLAMAAEHEVDRQTELAALAATTVVVPWLSGDIHDVRGLGRLACHLRGVADQADSS